VADHQCTDSAGGASSILSGQKANYATVGVNSNVVRFDCESQPGNEIDTILKWSQDAGEGQGGRRDRDGGNGEIHVATARKMKQNRQKSEDRRGGKTERGQDRDWAGDRGLRIEHET
jgi:hypothetical protein